MIVICSLGEEKCFSYALLASPTGALHIRLIKVRLTREKQREIDSMSSEHICERNPVVSNSKG